MSACMAVFRVHLHWGLSARWQACDIQDSDLLFVVGCTGAC